MPQCTFPTPIGSLTVEEQGGAIISVRLTGLLPTAPETPLLRQAERELTAYFSGTLRRFTLPFALRGTPFQCRVWQEAVTIPYGQTRTYGQIAAAMGKPGVARAVGGALHRNPLLLIVPCHRVLGADGSLTGFGCGVERKSFLLSLERENLHCPC